MNIADIDAVTLSSDGEDEDASQSPGGSSTDRSQPAPRQTRTSGSVVNDAQNKQRPQHAESREVDRDATRQRLVRYFRHYNPEKLATVDEILQAYQDAAPSLLWAHLEAKYGKESSIDVDDASLSSSSLNSERLDESTGMRGVKKSPEKRALTVSGVSTPHDGHPEEAVTATDVGDAAPSRVLRTHVNLQLAIRDTSAFDDRATRFSSGKQRKESALDRLRGAAKQAAAMASVTRMTEHRIALELVYSPELAADDSYSLDGSSSSVLREVDEERSKFTVFRLPAMQYDDHGNAHAALAYQPSDIVFCRPLCDLIDVQARDLGRKDMVTFRYIPADDDEEEGTHCTARDDDRDGSGVDRDDSHTHFAAATADTPASSLLHSRSAATLTADASLLRLPRSATTMGGASSGSLKHHTTASSNVLYRRLKRYAPPRSCFGSIGLCLLFCSSPSSSSSVAAQGTSAATAFSEHNFVDARFQSSRRRDEWAEPLKRVIASKMRLRIRHGLDDEVERQTSVLLNQSIAKTLASRPAVDKFVGYFQSQAQDVVTVDAEGDVTVVDTSKPPFGGVALFLFSERVTKPRRIYVKEMKTRRPDGVRVAAAATVTVEPHLVIAPSTLRQQLRGVPTLAFPLRTLFVLAESDQWGNTFFLVRKDEAFTVPEELAAAQSSSSRTAASSGVRVTVTTKSFVDRLKWLRWFQLILGRPAEFLGASTGAGGDTATGTAGVPDTAEGFGDDDNGGLVPWGGDALQRHATCRQKRRSEQDASLSPSISGILGSTRRLRGDHDGEAEEDGAQGTSVNRGIASDARQEERSDDDDDEGNGYDNDGEACQTDADRHEVRCDEAKGTAASHIEGPASGRGGSTVSPGRQNSARIPAQVSRGGSNNGAEAERKTHGVPCEGPDVTEKSVVTTNTSMPASVCGEGNRSTGAPLVLPSPQDESEGILRQEVEVALQTPARRRARTVHVVECAVPEHYSPRYGVRSRENSLADVDRRSMTSGSVAERPVEVRNSPSTAKSAALVLPRSEPDVEWMDSQCVVGARERDECWVLVEVPNLATADVAGRKVSLHPTAAPVRVQLCRFCVVSDPNSRGFISLSDSAAAAIFRPFGADVVNDVCLFVDRIRRVRVVFERMPCLVSADADALEWCEDVLCTGASSLAPSPTAGVDAAQSICWLELYMDRLSLEEEAAALCEELVSAGSDVSTGIGSSAPARRAVRRAFLSPQRQVADADDRSECEVDKDVAALRMHVIGNSAIHYSVDGQTCYYHDYADATAALRVVSALAPFLP